MKSWIFIIFCFLSLSYSIRGYSQDLNEEEYITLYGTEYNITGMTSTVYEYSIVAVDPAKWGNQFWYKGYHKFSINKDSTLIIYDDGENKIPLILKNSLKKFINYQNGELYNITTGLYSFEQMNEVFIIEFVSDKQLSTFGHSGNSFDKQTRLTIVYVKSIKDVVKLEQWKDD